MKTILFSAHDPGGVNVLSPLIEDFLHSGEYFIYLALLGPAKKKIVIKSEKVFYFELNEINIERFPNEKSVRSDEVSELFKKNKFDFVFTATSYNSNIEKMFIKYAKINKIPVFSIIDYWSNYRLRFTLNNEMTIPDIVFVTDQKMFNECKNDLLYENIIISGNPHLKKFLNDYSIFRSKVKKTSNLRIRFFSENMKLYFPGEEKFHEFYIVTNVLNFLKKINTPVTFILRPHPMESQEPWMNFIKDFNLNNTGSGIHMELDSVEFRDMFSDDFIAIGMASMVLVETSLMGIPTFSYQMEFKDNPYYYLPFEEYNISRLIEEKDLYKILNKEVRENLKIKYPDSFNIIHNTIKKFN